MSVSVRERIRFDGFGVLEIRDRRHPPGRLTVHSTSGDKIAITASKWLTLRELENALCDAFPDSMRSPTPTPDR